MIFEPFDFSQSPWVRTHQQNPDALLNFFIFVIYEGELESNHGFYALFYFLDPFDHYAEIRRGVHENLQMSQPSHKVKEHDAHDSELPSLWVN